MKRLFVVLACIALLSAGLSTTVGGEQSTATETPTAESPETEYALQTNGSAPLHDRQATVGDADVNVTSLVGLFPGEEALVGVTAPEDELAVVTVRSVDGTVVQKSSVTTGENVLVDSTDYEPGSYYITLSTNDEVRTASLLVVSSYKATFGLENVTSESERITGDATVAGGVRGNDSVQFVLTNETSEFRTDASEIRRGLYEFGLSLENVSDGNYTARIEVVGERVENDSRTILGVSPVRNVTVGDVSGDSTTSAATQAAAEESTEASAETETGAITEGEADSEAGATNSTVPDLAPVLLFAVLFSWAVVARVRRRVD
ncbi:T9SS type A sorting domain-containing protein [Halogeometricum limi]|uniref:Por secretion system C-terminal sorting domain-containing protein n=1 Tax=Halogeometricum limi TaxID=555875 RepID=A0A1I6IMD2_9EURY|nr:T9SS type A sorting domain-containing protein [Halogeometricum limi]SFR67873.1 Por secretion system C-terminal sorting domain-containing protein [Halogeometricum limi]